MKYIMYLRKSSESEDRQALSIPAQEAELRELAERRGLEVFDEPLRESMSAKKPGRPLFARMIEFLNTGTVAGVLCWHGDRLARNPLDGGVVMWMLGQGTIAEIVTPGKTFTSSSDDKLLLSITFGMATKYSDDLSKNVKRGNLESVKRGIWPGPCKVGYVRDPVSKEHKPDPDRFNRMTQMILATAKPRDARGSNLPKLTLKWLYNQTERTGRRAPPDALTTIQDSPRPVLRRHDQLRRPVVPGHAPADGVS